LRDHQHVVRDHSRFGRRRSSERRLVVLLRLAAS
jgi:hypothetical protein